jgi:carbonic anhydrase/acetyltransferase-like protein (isoleucine patch superfamily)
VVTGKTGAPAGWLLMGNPAKLVRNLSPEELMANLKNATEYVVLGKKTFGTK